MKNNKLENSKLIRSAKGDLVDFDALIAKSSAKIQSTEIETAPKTAPQKKTTKGFVPAAPEEPKTPAETAAIVVVRKKKTDQDKSDQDKNADIL